MFYASFDVDKVQLFFVLVLSDARLHWICALLVLSSGSKAKESDECPNEVADEVEPRGSLVEVKGVTFVLVKVQRAPQQEAEPQVHDG